MRSLPVGLLDRVLLREHPAVASLSECAHERVRHIRVVWAAPSPRARTREPAALPAARTETRTAAATRAVHRLVLHGSRRATGCPLASAQPVNGTGNARPPRSCADAPTGRNQRLMHVHRDRARDSREPIAAIMRT